MIEQKIEKGSVKSFFVKIDGLSRIYDSENDLKLFLWRASRTDSPCENPLYPDFVARELRKGKFRPADVTVITKSGTDFVVPKAYKKLPDDIWKIQGTSLFNKPDVFPGKNWEYIEIPRGTKIPSGILIVKDDFNKEFNATHYSIVPDHMMSVKQFKLLLNELLTNIELCRGEIKNAKN